MDEYPNFAAWSRGNLDSFALEAFIRMRDQAQTIEHMRKDLHDAMSFLRTAMRDMPRPIDPILKGQPHDSYLDHS